MIGLFNNTITLLNRAKNSDYTDSYYKTVIGNVCVQHNIKADNNATNSKVSSLCSVYIHKNILPKQYLKPKDWVSGTSKGTTITFKEDDYFVVGEISETSITDINSIYNKYDNVFKIYSVAEFNVIEAFHLKGK